MQNISRFSPLWGVWEVDGLLGEGSFAKVYRVRRTELGKTYLAAVKHISIPSDNQSPDALIRDGLATNQTEVTNFYKSMLESITNEINTCYRLKSNTNIVGYEDHMIVPKPSGIGYDIFIRMELLRSLDERANSAPLLETEVVKLGVDLCKALELLDREKLIHRDIKPANIFLNSAGDYKLGDFGVARSLESTLSSVTVKGTYNYMSPEVLKGLPVNNTTDIYSLGIVLYRYLNGNRLPLLPAAGQITYDESQNALDRRMSGERLPPPAYTSLPGLRETVLRACEFDPQRRFQHASDMRQALESVLSGNPNWAVINGEASFGSSSFKPVRRPEGGGTVTAKKQNLPLIIGISAGAVVALSLAVVIGVLLSGKNSGASDAATSPQQAVFATTLPEEIVLTEAPATASSLQSVVSETFTAEEISSRVQTVRDYYFGSYDDAVAAPGVEVRYDYDGGKRLVYLGSKLPGYELCYYGDNICFVYIFNDYNGVDEDRLYYAEDGQTLVRWVSGSTIHDMDTQHADWYYMESEGLRLASAYNYYPGDVDYASDKLYRVRSSWTEIHSQIGAYGDWDAAVSQCDKNPGYHIYNSRGEKLYTSGDNAKNRFLAVKIDGITWEDAAEAAERAGGHLAVPNSSAEWDAIIAACDSAGIKRAWIGGWNSIDYTTNSYVQTYWEDGTTQSDVPWWHEGEPSCYDPGSDRYENYILLWDLHNNGHWTLNDVPNDAPSINPKGYNGSFGYVIEFY